MIVETKKSNDRKFWGLVIIGTAFAAAGFISPPLGEIGNSVLIWSGECLVLAGAIMGINLHFDVKEILGLNDRKQEGTEKTGEDVDI